MTIWYVVLCKDRGDDWGVPYCPDNDYVPGESIFHSLGTAYDHMEKWRLMWPKVTYGLFVVTETEL